MTGDERDHRPLALRHPSPSARPVARSRNAPSKTTKYARIAAQPDIESTAGNPRLVLDDRAPELTPVQRELFDALYRNHFDFVFRNLRRMGVVSSAIDDALQDVYLVALRRLGDFKHGTLPKAWLFAILVRVAGNHRRSQRRRGPPLNMEEDVLEARQPDPFELTAQQQARRTLHAFLDTLDDNRRAAFVMTELEQMSAPEIAHALGAKVNTVYGWLRTARIEFVDMLEQRAHGGKPRRG